MKKRKKVDWQLGIYPGKLTKHWLREAFERIASGEKEGWVMWDYGYYRLPKLRKALHLACLDLVDGIAPPGKEDAKAYERFYMKEAGK